MIPYQAWGFFHAKPVVSVLYVTLDRNLVTSYKVGPKGKTNETSIEGLIKLAAARG